jgi:hypothetical protein
MIGDDIQAGDLVIATTYSLYNEDTTVGVVLWYKETFGGIYVVHLLNESKAVSRYKDELWYFDNEKK